MLFLWNSLFPDMSEKFCRPVLWNRRVFNRILVNFRRNPKFSSKYRINTLYSDINLYMCRSRCLFFYHIHIKNGDFIANKKAVYILRFFISWHNPYIKYHYRAVHYKPSFSLYSKKHAYHYLSRIQFSKNILLLFS